MGQARATLGTSKDEPIDAPSASEGSPTEGSFAKRSRKRPRAGVGAPEAAVGETQRPTPTPPRRGATHNSATKLGLFSHSPLGAGKRNWRGVWKGDNATPNAAAPRPMGQRPSWDEYGDASRTMPHRARRGGAGVFFSVVGNRERRPRREWDNPLASQPDSLARHNQNNPSTHHQ